MRWEILFSRRRQPGFSGRSACMSRKRAKRQYHNINHVNQEDVVWNAMEFLLI